MACDGYNIRNGHDGQTLVKALSYSTCLADAITGAAQRGFVQSVFRAAANIIFPGNFILSLNALDTPRVPNSVQLSAPGGTPPFSSLHIGMPVLLGARRLHIEALPLSLDLTSCTRWHPKIIRAEQLHLTMIKKNSIWLTQHVANLPARLPRPYPHSTPGYPQGVGFSERGRASRSCVGTGGWVAVDEGALSWWDIHSPARTGTRPPLNPAQPPVPMHTIASFPKTLPLAGTLAEAGAGSVAEAATSVHDMAQQLCGRGLGLTPTGDDILAGWMAANWLLHGAHPRLLVAYQDILAVAERQTHLLSQCWLRYAAEGYVAESIGLLLQALTRENETELASAAQAVLALGATSGRDVIHGILLGLAGIPAW